MNAQNTQKETETETFSQTSGKKQNGFDHQVNHKKSRAHHPKSPVGAGTKIILGFIQEKWRKISKVGIFNLFNFSWPLLGFRLIWPRGDWCRAHVFCGEMFSKCFLLDFFV